jgi:hypothetical protein
MAKRDRALAIIEHLLESPKSRTYSRLSLVVLGGVLQSLVDATPICDWVILTALPLFGLSSRLGIWHCTLLDNLLQH